MRTTADRRPDLPTEALADVLGVREDRIVRREPLEDWMKPGRGIERVTFLPGADLPPAGACVNLNLAVFW